MSKTWTFIGGVITGVIGVFAAATAAVALEERQKTDVVLDDDERTLTDVDAEEHDHEDTVGQPS